MTAYVAFVAITNLVLGFVLARLLPFALPWPARFSRAAAGLPVLQAHEPPAHPAPASPAPARAENPAAKPAPAKEPSAPKPAKAMADATPEQRWMETARELENIRQRLNYSRTNADKSLVKEVTAQLLTWTESYLVRLLACLQPESTELSGVLGEQLDPTLLEMQAAQAETTQANLRMLDWNDPLEAIIDRLERELAALDQNDFFHKIASLNNT